MSNLPPSQAISKPIMVSMFLLLALVALDAQASPIQAQVRLSEFSATSGPIRLRDEASSIDLFLPLSGTSEMIDAQATLRITHSIALLPERSVLSVRFNETTLAQLPYDPKQPVVTARVRLPAELWRPGYNKLTLAVTQHYSDRYEDPEAPELWTEIDLHESRLDYTLGQIDRPLILADLGDIFSPGLGGHETALLLSGPANDANVSIIEEALPLVAQALALRRQYAPLKLQHRTIDASARRDDAANNLRAADFPGVHVLVGTFGELAPVLGDALIGKVTGPHLYIERIVVDKDAQGESEKISSIRLVVTGVTAKDVLVAAQTLAVMDDAFNPVANLTVLDIERNDPSRPLTARSWLRPGASYAFESLGTATTTMSGIGSHSIVVGIPIPPAFYTTESAKAELLLDFGYGAGMGPGSVMNIMINGEFVHGALFDAQNGASFTDYRILFPARKLLPGRNLLQFEVSLRPQIKVSEFPNVRGRHLIAQVSGTSRITLPQAGAVSVQPDLALFAATAFPYGSTERVVPSRVVAASEDMLGSALTLVGKLAQAAKAPIEGFRLSLGIDEEIGGQAIVLATPLDLPSTLYDNWSAAIGRSVRWPYRALNDLRATMRGGGGEPSEPLTKTLDRLVFGEEERHPLAGSVTQDQGLGDLGAIVALRNPYQADPATITLFVADSSDLLSERIADLIQPRLWGALGGTLAVWRDSQGPMTTMQVAGTFEIGERDRWLMLRLVLSRNPWYLIGVAIGLSLIIAFVGRMLVRRRRAKLAES